MPGNDYRVALARRYWFIWVFLPVILSALLKKVNSFYYRTVASMTSLGFCAMCGVFASLTLPPLGKTHLLNWSMARMHYRIAGYLTGISTEIEGIENLDKVKGPKVLVCNHQASLDVLLMCSVFPKATSVVAKKSLKYYPFLGWYMTLSKAIFLDRKNRNSAIKEARQAAEDMHKKNTSVWLFPEGTRGHPREINMLPFKKGAFYMAVQAHVPIVPIVIANYNNIYDSKDKRFLPGKVRIRVLPPVSTDGVSEDSAAIDELASCVRESMLETLREISEPIQVTEKTGQIKSA